MNLDLDVQLQVAIRALEDVIAPALGNAEKHVIEQLHLAIATAGFVKRRLPDARRYARMELAAYCALAEESVSCSGSADALERVAARGRKVMASAEADTDEIVTATRRLREEVAALGSRSAGTEAGRKLDRLVLGHSAAMVGQARQWASPYGFELNPEELPAPAW